MNIKYYPYIGLFTNNPYDIRGLEFIEIYKNNKEELYIEDNTGKKILKYKYYKLFEDQKSFIEKLIETIREDYNNPIIKKWFFDFFSNFIDFSNYNFENLFINYEDSYDIIIEIKKNLPNFHLDDLIEERHYVLFALNISNYIENILIEFDKFFYTENNNFSETKIIDNTDPWNNFTINTSYSLDKTFIHKSFNDDFNKSFLRALEIDKNLNNKYDLYFKIQRANEQKDWEIDIKYYDNDINGHCYKIYLNMKDSDCNDLLPNVILEDGYGKYSKELFENDENFIVFNKFDQVKKLNHANMKIIMHLLNKLKFKKRILYLNYIKGLKPDDAPNYIQYYEKFELWEKHQTINKKLNNQPHLRDYLNTCIDIINRRITYLNPYFEDFIDLTKKIFISLEKSDEAKVKDSHKKLINLLNKEQNIELDKIIKCLDKNRNELKRLINKNTHLIDYNYKNNLGLIMSLFNNPSKFNLSLVSYMLNSSYKFNKSLFEF